MASIDALTGALQTIVTAGLGLRIIYCFVKLQHEEEEAPRYKKRIKNSAIIWIIATMAFTIADTVKNYYSM